MPAGDFSAHSVCSADEVKPKLGASLLDLDLRRATVLSRVVISQAQRKREITPFVAKANTVSRYFSAGTRMTVGICLRAFATLKAISTVPIRDWHSGRANRSPDHRMICGRRRTDMASSEVDLQPKLPA